MVCSLLSVYGIIVLIATGLLMPKKHEPLLESPSMDYLTTTDEAPVIGGLKYVPYDMYV